MSKKEKAIKDLESRSVIEMPEETPQESVEIASPVSKHGIPTDIKRLDYVLVTDTSEGIPKGRSTFIFGDSNLRKGFIGHLKTKVSGYTEVSPADIPSDGDIQSFNSELVILNLEEPVSDKDFYLNISNHLDPQEGETSLLINANFELPTKHQYGLYYSSLMLRFSQEDDESKMYVSKSKINKYQGYTVVFDPNSFSFVEYPKV